ncbi:hypothetical protein Tco_0512424 [Tanacetum coccineum]
MRSGLMKMDMVSQLRYEYLEGDFKMATALKRTGRDTQEIRAGERVLILSSPNRLQMKHTCGWGDSEGIKGKKYLASVLFLHESCG